MGESDNSLLRKHQEHKQTATRGYVDRSHADIAGLDCLESLLLIGFSLMAQYAKHLKVADRVETASAVG